MGIKKINLLNPSNEKIKEIIKQHEEDWGYGDKVLYMRCVEDMKKVNLCRIQKKDIGGHVSVFLINWGMMGRVLGRKEIKGWEKKLLGLIPKLCNDLESFRKMRLEHTTLSTLEIPIKNCYKQFEKILKPTSASKILHLIAPNFFPMWDMGIRQELTKECKKLYGYRIEDSPRGYYKFITEIQKFLRNYNQTISELSKKYKKPKLRIVDAFMWNITRD